jgi:hypothetical protein
MTIGIRALNFFSRNRIDELPSKVKQYKGDLLEFETFKKDFTGDEIFLLYWHNHKENTK